jgi:hypothetical protein
MKNSSEDMIETLGGRSNAGVWITTIAVLAVPIILSALTGAREAAFLGVAGVLCFIYIPVIHFLCREVLRLRERVRQLEAPAGRHEKT